MKTAYIVQGYRTAVGKAPRGVFRFKRPDELAAETIEHLLKDIPQLDKKRIDDVIVGNAMPEAEQGLNMGRLISLMGLKIEDVPGMTVNRYCASGLETVSIAVAKIQSGMADCIIAGGVESMSYIPMGGYRPVPNYKSAKEGHEDYYWGMGLTAEAVAQQFKVSREDQDEFAFKSHMKALEAQANGTFNDDLVPITVENIFLDENGKKQTKNYTVSADEGPRKGTSIEALSKLRPVFAQGGSVTAGNSSQMSDGAAFLLVMSEEMVKELNIEPIARMVSFAAVGVEPRIMGIGPVKAIPKALKQANLTLNDIDLIELNEAFASQSLAVMRELNINQDIVNVNGGAIALGHPLGCTGAKLSVQLFNEMRRRKNKYGVVTMCVGTGQGAAGVYELLK
ncbi:MULTISPECIES: acetyl-CoA C-acyltransferase [Flavobacteriaceae]|uniref:acetyl-CoA C-acyltransferase n=2 Tax=Flavobacteriaceae TaxID=49546 RepID=A0A4Y8ANI2_9FLAO|nr:MULTISPECIES: acetyl-CoA C-acyltransferase [Flavobacteriaceae]TEW71867.1 acetyl-CoA C-acyltransferase [Gramella jeungdoensis]GGK59906.1 acetyl-CoA acetyltransferase [Lutibacter litoralis]